MKEMESMWDVQVKIKNTYEIYEEKIKHTEFLNFNFDHLLNYRGRRNIQIKELEKKVFFW